MLCRHRFIILTQFIVTAFVTSAQLLVLADDPTTSSDGYKTVPVKVGNSTVPIRVRQEPNPLQNFSAPDPSAKYDPQRIFSSTNSMANKKFDLPSSSASQGSSTFTNPGQNSFFTKSYAIDHSAPTVPNLNTNAGANLPTASAFSRNASGFDKSYSTSAASAGQNQTALIASATSPDQNRTAVLGGQTTSTFADPDANKVFQGEEADAAKRHLSRAKNGQIVITDLPSRPMTIDEVRDLINHGFAPNTDAKPPEPSKPLNDPNYVPTPLRDMPAPDASTPAPQASLPADGDDKNDLVPPPGTMAAPQPPENSQPLPQP